MPPDSRTSSDPPPVRRSGFPPGSVIVEARALGKRYERSGENRKLVRSLLLLASRGGADGNWPVRNVSFELRAGETLGLIGENGCGKTTLLSLIAGATYPTEGEVSVRGRVSALLALGTGFDYEMTALEAILVNAVILGLTVEQARERTAQILTFAELADEGSTRIRYLSSGMRARLSFAIGVLTTPDVLLVDEVLAVGDEAFQEKCRSHVDKMRASGCGIVFVSHDMHLVRKICTRVMWLDRGSVAADGEPEDVVSKYLTAVGERAPKP